MWIWGLLVVTQRLIGAGGLHAGDHRFQWERRHSYLICAGPLFVIYLTGLAPGTVHGDAISDGVPCVQLLNQHS